MDKLNHRQRRRFKSHLIKSPSYFGNLFEGDLPDLHQPMLEKIGDTSSAKMGCLG